MLLLSPVTAAAQTARLDVAASNTWWGQIPIMVAIDKGFFKDQGIDTELKNIPASGDRVAALTAGSVAFSNLGRIAAIVEMARGNQSFYFFANIDDCPGNEGCWARPGFADFKALRGKKVAANTSAEITMNGLLENAGMTEQDIQFVNLPGGEMAAALAKGDVDAACVWEPLLSDVAHGTPGGKLLGLDSDTPNFKKFGTMASPDIMIISPQAGGRAARPGAQAGGRDLQRRGLHQRPSAGDRRDGRALLPQAAGRGAGRDEDVQVFRRRPTGSST